MSLSNDNVTIITRPDSINIGLVSGGIDITALPQEITVKVGATINSGAAVYIWNETPTGNINGSNATFTSLQNFVPNTLQVFINGILQVSTNDYTTSGSTIITLNVSPVSGDVIRIHYKLG